MSNNRSHSFGPREPWKSKQKRTRQRHGSRDLYAADGCTPEAYYSQSAYQQSIPPNERDIRPNGAITSDPHEQTYTNDESYMRPSMARNRLRKHRGESSTSHTDMNDSEWQYYDGASNMDYSNDELRQNDMNVEASFDHRTAPVNRRNRIETTDDNIRFSDDSYGDRPLYTRRRDCREQLTEPLAIKDEEFQKSVLKSLNESLSSTTLATRWRKAEDPQDGDLASPGTSGMTQGNRMSQSPPPRRRPVQQSSKSNKQLMKALAQPVESTKAERMMKMMGWQGGSLGAKNDGIAEPLVPNLFMVSDSTGRPQTIHHETVDPSAGLMARQPAPETRNQQGPQPAVGYSSSTLQASALDGRPCIPSLFSLPQPGPCTPSVFSPMQPAVPIPMARTELAAVEQRARSIGRPFEQIRYSDSAKNSEGSSLVDVGSSLAKHANKVNRRKNRKRSSAILESAPQTVSEPKKAKADPLGMISGKQSQVTVNSSILTEAGGLTKSAAKKQRARIRKMMQQNANESNGPPNVSVANAGMTILQETVCITKTGFLPAQPVSTAATQIASNLNTTTMHTTKTAMPAGLGGISLSSSSPAGKKKKAKKLTNTQHPAGLGGSSLSSRSVAGHSTHKQHALPAKSVGVSLAASSPAGSTIKTSATHTNTTPTTHPIFTPSTNPIFTPPTNPIFTPPSHPIFTPPTQPIFTPPSAPRAPFGRGQGAALPPNPHPAGAAVGLPATSCPAATNNYAIDEAFEARWAQVGTSRGRPKCPNVKAVPATAPQAASDASGGTMPFKNKFNIYVHRRVMNRQAQAAANATLTLTPGGEATSAASATSVENTAVVVCHTSKENGAMEGQHHHRLPPGGPETSIASAKRACVDEAIPPRGEPKTPSQPPPRANDSIQAVIFASGGKLLDNKQAECVPLKLVELLLNETIPSTSRNQEDINFMRKPMYGDGSVRLFCRNSRTVEWLKSAIKHVVVPGVGPLAIRWEPQKRVWYGVLLPGAWQGRNAEIGRLLRMQNSWAEINRWLVHAVRPRCANTLVVLSVPEDIAEKIVEHGRRLHFGVGAVYLQFWGDAGTYGKTLPTAADGAPRDETSATTKPDTHPPCDGQLWKDTAAEENPPTKPMLLPTSSPMAAETSPPTEPTPPPISSPMAAETSPPTEPMLLPTSSPMAAETSSPTEPTPPPISSPMAAETSPPTEPTPPPISSPMAAETSPPTEPMLLPTSLPMAAETSPPTEPTPPPISSPMAAETSSPTEPTPPPISSPMAAETSSPTEPTSPPISSPMTAETSPPTEPMLLPISSPMAAETSPPTEPMLLPTSSPMAAETNSPTEPTPPPISSPMAAETSPPTEPMLLPTSLPMAAETSPPTEPTPPPISSPMAAETSPPTEPMLLPTSLPMAAETSPPPEPTPPPISSPMAAGTSSPTEPTPPPISSPMAAETSPPTEPTPPPISSPMAAETNQPTEPTPPPISSPMAAETSPPNEPMLLPTSSPMAAETNPPTEPTPPPVSSPMAAETSPPTEPMLLPISSPMAAEISPPTEPMLLPTSSPMAAETSPPTEPMLLPVSSPMAAETSPPTEPMLLPISSPMAAERSPPTEPTPPPISSPMATERLAYDEKRLLDIKVQMLGEGEGPDRVPYE